MRGLSVSLFEGPIAQIGSAFGSALGQLLRMNLWQCNTLIAAGAGGGIAATFNTPLGGLIFATEILLPGISVRTLVPVFIATATATYLGQLFFGICPAFKIPALESPFIHLDNPLVLLAYVGLGVALGVVSAVLIRSLYGCEGFFENNFPGNDYVRHISGMLVVGLRKNDAATGHSYEVITEELNKMIHSIETADLVQKMEGSE